MRKNKKASIISLEVLIGVVISIIIFVSAATIISNFYRLSDASKDSFSQLVALIEEVNGDNHGTRKSMPLRMDEDTAIIGFPKNNEDFKAMGLITSRAGLLKGDYFFPKPVDRGCEKDKACICLCRELDSEYKKGEIKCKDEYLLCKNFEELEFSNPFLLSRSLDFYEPKKDAKASEFAQFRAVYVEKYSEYDENSVAVCKDTEEDSCISKEYKNKNKAIYGLKKLKEFIESCKDREFVNVEEPEPCSCGAFDFRSEIPEKYIVEFTESDKGKLKLILKHEDKEDKIIPSIEVDMPLCTYQPILKGTDLLPKDKSIILKYNLPPYYTFYYKEDVEDERIVFVKNSEGNICLLRSSERGYIKLYEESPDTITFKSVSNIQRSVELGHSEINITGCVDSATD